MLLSILRVLTYILGIAGSAFLLPLAVAIADSDRRMALVFLIPLLIGWAVAMAFWFAVRKRPKVFDVKSAFGVVGIETALPVMYTEFVRTGIITLERLSELMSVNPRERFGIPTGGDFTVFDVSNKYRIDPADFVSMGKSTPFMGREVYGKCILTVTGGKIVWQDSTTEN
jgi:hypothetical protein